jgi:hypothetical protein
VIWGNSARWAGNKELGQVHGRCSAAFAEGALTVGKGPDCAGRRPRGPVPTVLTPYPGLSGERLECGGDDGGVHVACALQGGASLVHRVQMRNVAEKLSM